MHRVFPSAKNAIWMLVFGLVAVALYNNVGFLNKVAGPRG